MLYSLQRSHTFIEYSIFNIIVVIIHIWLSNKVFMIWNLFWTILKLKCKFKFRNSIKLISVRVNSHILSLRIQPLPLFSKNCISIPNVFSNLFHFHYRMTNRVVSLHKIFHTSTSIHTKYSTVSKCESVLYYKTIQWM